MESPRKWERLEKSVVLTTPWLQIARDRYRLPGGEDGEYTYVDIPGSTMIVPRLDDGRLLMVRQHRYLMGRESLEFPAGGIPRGREPLENAREELRQEAGLAADRLEKIGEFAPYNGVSNESCHVFLATGLREVGAEPDPTEEFERFILAPEEVRRRVESGEIWDGMTLATYALYTHRPV